MRPTKRSCKLIALALALTLALAGCGKNTAAEKHERQLFAMDTVMLLTAYGDAGDAALAAAVDTINALAADLDPEKDGSSVYALNTGAGGPVAVSADCLAVLDTALAVYRETDGALDPALYPVIQAWGFTTGQYRVPEPSELDELLAAKNTDSIILDAAAGTVALPAGMAISLGAVAKGYAEYSLLNLDFADVRTIMKNAGDAIMGIGRASGENRAAIAAQQAIDAARAAGVDHAIFSLGGNVQTLGDTRPDGQPWQVAVTDPNDTGSYVGTLSVGQTAVVTSGGYQRYFDQDGQRYIHILDPATGRPVDNGLLSVTVVTPDGTRADALSTALFVLGEDGALSYAAAHEDVDLVLVTDDGRVIVTAGLAGGFTEHAEGYTYEYP